MVPYGCGYSTALQKNNNVGSFHVKWFVHEFDNVNAVPYCFNLGCFMFGGLRMKVIM